MTQQEESTQKPKLDEFGLPVDIWKMMTASKSRKKLTTPASKKRRNRKAVNFQSIC